MTSPDHLVPDGAYSAASQGNSLAGLPGVTQRQIEERVRGQMVRSFAAIPVNLATAVRVGLHEFAADFCEAVTGFTGGLVNLQGWAQVLREKAAEARASAGDSQRVADLAERMVTESGDGLAATNSRVQVVIDGLPIRPYWAAMNLAEESSIPRAMLVRKAWDVVYGTKPGYAAYTYTYIAYYDSNGLPVYSTQTFSVRWTPVSTPPANALAGAYIRSRFDGGRQLVTYMVDAAPGDPCALYVVVGRVLESGDIRIEWVSADQTPLITNSRFEHSVEMPVDLVFDTGESVFIGVHQCGPGAVRPLLGIPATESPRPATAQPARAAATFAAATPPAVGERLAESTLDFSSGDIPYVGLSKKLLGGDPPKLIRYEGFDRGVIPTSFARMTALPAGVAAGVFVVSGGTDGVRRYLYARSMNYDDHMVTGCVIDPTVRHAWLMLRSGPGNTEFVSLNVVQNSIAIYRYAGGTWTQLSAVETTVNSGDVLRIKAIGNVYLAQRRIGGDWVDVVTYIDADGILPSGRAHRYAGLGNERVSWVNGGGWDFWKVEDL
ncbi:hypothetical protein [Nocardia rhizosphaerae]|uniref:Minor tail protein n=1 Tax=Nocardia rhizosphaerae TaxID=1691571 RepID=A0ABV8L819_9NOCA